MCAQELGRHEDGAAEPCRTRAAAPQVHARVKVAHFVFLFSGEVELSVMQPMLEERGQQHGASPSLNLNGILLKTGDAHKPQRSSLPSPENFTL
jgi:hypothetical protein